VQGCWGGGGPARRTASRRSSRSGRRCAAASLRARGGRVLGMIGLIGLSASLRGSKAFQAPHPEKRRRAAAVSGGTWGLKFHKVLHAPTNQGPGTHTFEPLATPPRPPTAPKAPAASPVSVCGKGHTS